MIEKEALEYITSLVDEGTIEVGDRQWVKDGYSEIVPPIPKALGFYTLTSFVAFVQMAEDRDGTFIHVVSPTEVSLVGELTKQQTRKVYAIAKPIIDGRFETGRWMGQDSFVTNVQAFFDDDPQTDKAKLLKVTGTIRADDSVTLEDDGISQQVATAAGVASVALETLPNPVVLRPFETFAEIDQPLRKYIVRFQGGEMNERVTLALFTVPNPKASFDTCGDIKTWLQNELPGAFEKKVLG